VIELLVQQVIHLPRSVKYILKIPAIVTHYAEYTTRTRTYIFRGVLSKPHTGTNFVPAMYRSMAYQVVPF